MGRPGGRRPILTRRPGGRVPILLGAALLGCTSVELPPDDAPPLSEQPLRLVPVAQGLERPVLAVAPEADPRLFVVEQAGRIRVIDDGNLEAEPFLDITDRVGCCGERGLLGLAFDPDYRSNERFFVSYTDRDGNSVVEAFRSIDRSNRADPTSGTVFLRVDQPFGNHNGGHLAFGPDRMLYVGLGDGGSAADPMGNGQDPRTLLGSILRVDVSQAFGPPYRIPPDNPFADGVDGRPEIWHFGLRNPWRFSFDRNTGWLFIGDVGQTQWEEIDAVRTEEAGHNFGWSTMEGHECFQGACEADGLTLPVAVYGHEDGCSVTGGYVYRGQELPALRGRYLYADYCAGWIRSFRLSDNGTATDPEQLQLQNPGRITSFGQDAGGEIYVVVESGTVFLIAPGGS